MHIISNTVPINIGDICLYGTNHIIDIGILSKIERWFSTPSVTRIYYMNSMTTYETYTRMQEPLILNSTILLNLLEENKNITHTEIPKSINAFDIINQKLNYNDICITILETPNGDCYANHYSYALFKFNNEHKNINTQKRVFKIDNNTLNELLLLKLKM